VNASGNLLETSNVGASETQEPMTMAHETETAGTEIRALLEAWAAAVRRHDMPAILALHAPDIVMFDLPPPLQAKGLEDYKKTWDLFFQSHKVSQAFDIEELSILAGGDVGFAFGIMRCGAGQDPAGFQFRVTIGLRRIDGAWCVVHEHHSLPAVDG
jgi:ketosteroid isomerase-like protein